jgi:phage replication-related protein YjqB (UPF0714/DUF867 family)
MDRHTYFAYGSNLCVEQMASRCPGASDPRPAVLADHDWLINERGVATLEPFIGSTVHGVVWTLTEYDLENLDSAEGVPDRYRRDRLTVQTAHGPATPWVYIDHRVQPGAPREGYLDRIINGALHHGLPHQWIEFLHRWDPAHWPMSRTKSEDTGPQTLSELLADPTVTEMSRLASRFGFMAIHGGGLEQMTDVIAERAAEQTGASVYVLRHPPDYPHHLSSARYLPEQSARLTEFLDHVDVVVSLHGYGRVDRSTQILAGGRNRELAGLLAQCIEVPGYQVVTDLNAIPLELRGLHPDNPVNRARGGGAQLELSSRVRGTSPRSQLPGRDGLTPATAALVAGLVAAAHSWSRQ